MAIEIITQVIPAIESVTNYVGSGKFEVDSGKSLKIETSPRGEDILDLTVPSGKKWEILLKLHITETNL